MNAVSVQPASRRRFLILTAALAGSVIVATTLPLVAVPPTPAYADGAADLLPSEADVRAALAPLNVVNYRLGPGIDGWDSDASIEVGGTPDGNVLSTVDASVLPTNEGAAGFLQTKLQQLRDGARQNGLDGDVSPAPANLTQDADESYFAVFVTPDGAPNRMLTAFLISRYENQVTSVQTLMVWDGPGAVPESAKTSVGAVLGLLARQVNDLAAED